MPRRDRLAIDGGQPVRTAPPPLGKGMLALGEEEQAAALAVLESRSLFRYYGPDLQDAVARFETEAAAVLDAPYALATSSGTAALRCILAALGVGCGDEVIVPAFTFIATVNAVIAAGAVPVFAEIDDTLGLDPADVAARINERTAAVIVVHLENVGSDMDPLMEVCDGAGVPVIEDAAQAMGASYRGRALGTIGTMGAFSLQLEKNITAGEGGLVVTADELLHVRAARYSDQGGQFVTSYSGERGRELTEPFAGENLRMAEMAGAVAAVQLRRLPSILATMRANKARVLTKVGEIAGLERRRRPDADGDGGSSITWFVSDGGDARQVARALRAEGIPAAQMYRGEPVNAAPSILAQRTASGKGGPFNCAEHPCRVEYRMGMCPRTEALVARSFIVPLGLGFTEADCDDVAEAVTKVAAHLLGP